MLKAGLSRCRGILWRSEMETVGTGQQHVVDRRREFVVGSRRSVCSVSWETKFCSVKIIVNGWW